MTVGVPTPTVDHAPAIQSYGGGGFRVAGTLHGRSLWISARGVLPWEITEIERDSHSIAVESLRAFLEAEPELELLLIGTGKSQIFLPASFHREIKAIKSVALEAMDTGAACRTFNVLAAEGRRVAAALIAV